MSNTPTFYSAPVSHTYCAFDSIHKAIEVQYHHQEHIIQIPGLHQAVGKKYTTDKNLLLDNKEKETLVSEGVLLDNKIALMSTVDNEDRYIKQ
jgi:hypothetical protein